MTPCEAKELSHLLARVGELLNQSAAFVRDHDAEENFIEYRTVVGKLMGDMFLDAMTPLYQRFPELLPDYLGGPYKIPESAYLPGFYNPSSEPHSMNAEEAKMLLKRLRDGVGQKSVALRCDCDNLEVVFITINENEGVCVTDGHRTFQYLNRGDNSTYIPIESLDLTIVQGICDDLSVEFKAAPEDGFQSIEYILNPSEQLSSAVERVAEAVDQIFKLAMRPDLK